MKTKKRFGQHFLKDKHLVTRILAALEAAPGERFLEIGPGPGTLTLPFNRLGFGLTVVEADLDMIDVLKQLRFDPPVEIIHADFLELDPAALIARPTKLFSNLPYNASVPITAMLLARSEHIPLMVFMYQKEVAERIRAQPHTKAYGPISVLAQAFYDFDLFFNVKPGAFYPPPKVNSQVIRFRRRATPLFPPGELAHMTDLLRFLFQQRRKMIGNRLKNWDPDWIRPVFLLESLERCGLDPRSRPENLSPADYARWLHTAKEHHARSTNT